MGSFCLAAACSPAPRLYRRIDPAAVQSRGLAADRNHPHHRAGRTWRHHRRDGPAARRASAIRLGTIRRGREPLRRRRHDRHDRSRQTKGRRSHHPDRQSRPQRHRLQHLPQPDLQAGSAAGGVQHDPDSEHRLGASIDRDQVDRGADRVSEGQSGQAELRLLGCRPEPSPHRRLVPATHGIEDDPRAVPRRRARVAGDARRRRPDPVRQYLSLAAAGAGRQAQRARASPRPSAAPWRPSFRPCANARRNSQGSRCPPGSA